MKKKWSVVVFGWLVLVITFTGCMEQDQEKERDAQGFEWFQRGTTHTIQYVHPLQSSELEDNRIGGIWDGFWAVDMDEIVNSEILPLGLKRVRLAINSIAWDAINWSKTESVVASDDDEVITRIAGNDILITYVLSFWDKQTWPNGVGVECPRFKTEEAIHRYLEYVRFIVGYFKDRVRYYEIWNEPDMGWDEENSEPCVQAIDVDDYITLVKRVVPVIREEYPDAKIVVGSTMPQVEPGSREYLLRILRSEVMPLVDVIAWHPGGPSPVYDFWRDYYYNYTSLVQEIKDTATLHGFKGEYTADEMVWWTQADFPFFEPWTYSKTVAAKYYARFIILHLGMNVTVKPGGLSIHREESFSTIQTLCTIMAGAEPIPVSVDLDCGSPHNFTTYGFTLSNGDTLVALWVDTDAVDEYPGVIANITVNNMSAQQVTGIDVVQGFQQSLTATHDTGTVLIQELIVRDYPLLLCIH